ncbi:MAG: methylated-DNA--[protein]-cysteine S-methyltransferase [Thermovenabulum sp.]|uniref:methylated-DNA--[protein]-cysteine S-methyltransferase n=1 Tax=Thermovenabulum sp. TaxID=3100335 RepID=UPI003C7C4DB6
MEIYYDDIYTPIGRLIIFSIDKYLIKISFENEKIDKVFFYRYFKNPFFIKKANWVIKKSEKELDLYFKKNLREFSVPLLLLGTEFQKKVWNELLKIPYGELKTYKDISQKMGIPKGARAVGQANNKNPIPIIVPCHRVIGKSGDLVGYGGGLNIKKYLIDLEKN